MSQCLVGQGFYQLLELLRLLLMATFITSIMPLHGFLSFPLLFLSAFGFPLQMKQFFIFLINKLNIVANPKSARANIINKPPLILTELVTRHKVQDTLVRYPSCISFGQIAYSMPYVSVIDKIARLFSAIIWRPITYSIFSNNLRKKLSQPCYNFIHDFITIPLMRP